MNRIADEGSFPHGAAAERKAGKRRRPVMMIASHFQEYSFRLARALAAEVDVVLEIETARLESEFADRDMPHANGVRVRNTTLTSPLDPLRLLWDALRFRPSIIHIQEPSGLRKAMICAAVVAIARRFSTIVLTVHDPEPHEGRDRRTARRLDRYRRYIRTAAKIVFVHGEFCWRQYQRCSPIKGQRVISIDHGEILTDGDLVDRSDEPFAMLCFGRMEAYKGIAVLADAAETLDQEGSLPSVHIAGAGPELDRLADRFDRLPGVQVDNMFVPSARLIDALQQTDCVVLPYLEATQSGVLAAAFANGRFAIASAVGGIPDVVDHGVNGLLVPPGDVAALADAIRLATADPELRRRLRNGALATAQDRLEWKQIAGTTLKEYRSKPV